MQHRCAEGEQAGEEGDDDRRPTTAVGAGPGAEERRATAIVVIGGQTLCLVATLIVTPVAYSVLDDLGQWLKKRLTRATTS